METTTADRTEILPAALIFQASKVGFPIRKSTDQRVFAPPRSLSQRITSFIACACQGIHQLPLRHLIVLIANAHPRLAPRTVLAEKTSFSRSIRWPAVKPPIICGELSVPRDKSPILLRGTGEVRIDLLFTMSCRTGGTPKRAANLFSQRMTLSPPLDGGAGRDRTDDPLLAKQVLSQLSYGP